MLRSWKLVDLQLKSAWYEMPSRFRLKIQCGQYEQHTTIYLQTGRCDPSCRLEGFCGFEVSQQIRDYESTQSKYKEPMQMFGSL